MCTTWSQERWITEAAKVGSQYSLLGTYTNADGRQALMIKDAADVVRNVYSADGWSEALFLYVWDEATGDFRENIPTDEQVQLAQADMTKRGFTLVAATAQVDTAVVVGSEGATQPLPEPGVVVQGKTLAEWEQEGKLNEERGNEGHVHPTDPEGDRQPNEAEVKAFYASLTSDEREVLELSALIKLMGGTASSIPA